MAKTTKQTSQRKPTKYSPQQIKFAMGYYLPSSPTFGNARRSALNAGYTEQTANNITREDHTWMKNIVDDLLGGEATPQKEELIKLSTKVMRNSLTSDDAKLAQDSAKFVLSTDPKFSKKQDITTGGENIDGLKISFGNFKKAKRKDGKK